MAAPRSPLALTTFEVGWRTRPTIRRREQEATLGKANPPGRSVTVMALLALNPFAHTVSPLISVPYLGRVHGLASGGLRLNPRQGDDSFEVFSLAGRTGRRLDPALN